MWLSIVQMRNEEKALWRWEIQCSGSENGHDFALVCHGTWCDNKSDVRSELYRVLQTIQLNARWFEA